ncbi:MAG: 2-amino-4-oxopentanoate thiolase subunit OrtA, partial [Bacillota bacterium]
MIKKGEWVRIHKIILQPSERAPQVPEDTKLVPLEMWDKGFLQEDANIGDEVTIETVTGRI